MEEANRKEKEALEPAEEQEKVLIKGSKEGLLFLLHDKGDFETIMEELSEKLDKANGEFFQGPIARVRIQLGNRQLSSEQDTRLRQLIQRRGNLVIQELRIESSAASAQVNPSASFQVVSGTIRSGQALYYEQDVLLLGDVNPGGTLMSTGDIIVLGSLRGLAHAGCTGNRDRLIAASYLRPTQLRIADRVSRSPDDWPEAASLMQYACLRGQQVVVEDIQRLDQFRPELSLFRRAIR